MMLRILRIILLCLYCIFWTGFQAGFILLILISVGPLGLLVSVVSFVIRGHFITEIEMMKMEHILEGGFHYMEWVVPDKILGR